MHEILLNLSHSQIIPTPDSVQDSDAFMKSLLYQWVHGAFGDLFVITACNSL